MNFEKLINTALEKSIKSNVARYKATLTDEKQKLYLIGKNEQSSELNERYHISGLIDDYNLSVDKWNGVPILKTKDIKPDSIVINCVTSISPVQVNNNLKAAGLSNVLQVSDLISGDGLLLSLPWFVSQQREEINEHLKWWSNFHGMLSDELSRSTLSDVLRFRLTADPEYMNDYTVRLQEQYFEDFMGYKNEIFVDAGGFDGDTTEEFISRYPDYKKVYLFEPSESNLIKAKQRLSGRRDIDFRSLGLSDTDGTLSFNADAGSASAVTQGEGDAISVVTLDSELKSEAISFIKMDLEGWEMNALRGAEETIRKNKPKLAIAVYHAAKDFREISQYVLSINPEYKVFLRHYTQGWSETVMFFL